MFQRLDQLRAGSLVILTGLPGAGKSHLATAGRSAGNIRVLDTEGAAQTLRNKPNIHRALISWAHLVIKVYGGVHVLLADRDCWRRRQLEALGYHVIEEESRCFDD